MAFQADSASEAIVKFFNCDELVRATASNNYDGVQVSVCAINPSESTSYTANIRCVVTPAVEKGKG